MNINRQNIILTVLRSLDESSKEHRDYKDISRFASETLGDSFSSTMLNTVLRILISKGLIIPAHDLEIERDEYRISEKGRDYLRNQPKDEETLFQKDSESEISIVVTKPLVLYNEFLDAQHTMDAFRELIDKAREHLWILTPYIDKYVIGLYHRNLRDMFRRESLDFRLIVSEVNRTAIEGLYLLMEHAKSVGRKGLDVRIFHSTQFFRTGGSGEVIRTNFSHAKLYLSEQAAFITSANLTNTSFVTNMELGVILRIREEIRRLEEIFLKLWTHSTPYEDFIE